MSGGSEASGDPKTRWLEPRPVFSQSLDFMELGRGRRATRTSKITAPQLKNLTPKSSASLPGQPLVKGLLTFGVSGRAQGWVRGRLGSGEGCLQAGVDSSALIMLPLAACLDNACSHAMHMSNYSQLAKSYDIIKPFNPRRT